MAAPIRSNSPRSPKEDLVAAKVQREYRMPSPEPIGSPKTTSGDELRLVMQISASGSPASDPEFSTAVRFPEEQEPASCE